MIDRGKELQIANTECKWHKGGFVNWCDECEKELRNPNTERNKICKTCGHDAFQIRDILSKPVFDGMQIFMGILYTCAVCKNEEYVDQL